MAYLLSATRRPYRTWLIFSSLFHSGYFYSALSSALILRGGPDYCIDTVPEVNTP